MKRRDKHISSYAENSNEEVFTEIGFHSYQLADKELSLFLAIYFPFMSISAEPK